ncbi:hypothetical protein HOY82DRAFT_552465 [Tuber indicum]|nr:hypothetical protein HOY82DRAFT_552465 [Tuber indicum]
MEANFAEALRDLDTTPGATNAMATPTTQDYTFDPRCNAPPSSTASQTESHVLTSRVNAMHQFTCSLPLDPSDNSTSNHLHSTQPETNTNSEGGQVEGFWPWEWEIYGDLLDGNGNSTSFTSSSSQVHESYSMPHANDTTTAPAQEWGNYNVDPEQPLIPPLFFPNGFQYSTPNVPKKVPTATQPSDNNGSGRGQLVNPHTVGSASPKVGSTNSRMYSNDSDGNSNDSRVTKAKKKHQCTEYGCGKRFGRSAELKRHRNSVHRNRIANEKRQKLLSCPHLGCTRVGELGGFKRKDNLVQHLRGVHGDVIGKKSGRRSAGRSPGPSFSNAGAGSPTIPIGNDQFFHSQQQQEPFPNMGQQQMMQEEGLGSPPVVAEFFENLPYWSGEGE